MPSYPNVEDVLCDLLDSIAYTDTWRDPERELPFIIVRRVGGNEDGITDRPAVRVQVTADDYESAKNLMGAVRERILNAGCTSVNGVNIDVTREIVGGQQAPAFNPEDISVTSTFVLSFRKQ
ncbi:hypothetical protein QNA24_30270 [Rhodococcus qingshengii]|uniref:phage tail termination protein n=1 Tax=Rhodococcus TaxID=1827 RepID=UPI001E50B378|nr:MULTISPECIES: hypothetical protein [Rhodococcus]MCD2099536.1 hypothetical protein [Rhodococcus rhodochrous]MCD2123904.1 hypothetical protein [Rhodococcus rhodochrous]MCQ4136669.1 hypothetical protein [Rhodococcus rhodochrous]MDJ0490670.1 hypothetical protein [Rhodococcus qingshengii]